MFFFDLFKDSSSFSKKSIRKNYVGNMVQIIFPTSKGEYTIKVQSLGGPDGRKGVMYDCFLVAIGKWQQQGMGEDDFIKDMQEVVTLVATGNSENVVMENLLRKHITQSGRLIDTDLCTYISELYLALVAIKGNCNRNSLLEQMMLVAERNFGDKLFITKYKRTGFGLQPYLIPFSELVRNQ